MKFRKIKRYFLRLLGNVFIVPLIIVLCKSLKIVEQNNSPMQSLMKNGENFVFAFWHGTMLVPWYMLRNHGLHTIVSQSKDGDILVKLLKKWKYVAKRGSSSKDGKETLNELVTDAKNNCSIAITPDGPRGPEKVMKAGAVIIAKKAQIPLVLIGVNYEKKIKLNSWDNFEIPHLFSRVKINYSEPIKVDGNLSYDETDKYIRELNDMMNKIQG